MGNDYRGPAVGGGSLAGRPSGPNRVAYIGFADLPEVGDLDHQDLVVRVGNIPEPATLALAGSGLLAPGLIRRRRAA